MLSNYNLSEIVKDGLSAIKGDSGMMSFMGIFLVLPVCITTLLWYFDYKISNDITSNIIGGIGLFAGLMFTLLFVVANNYKDRKASINSSDEEDVRYIKRYKEFADNIISLISISIVYAGALVLLIVVYSSSIESVLWIDVYSTVSEYLSPVIILLLIHFILIIIRILKEMYAMLYDDINK